MQVLRWNKQTKEIWSYIRNLAIELDSPVIQVFMRPLSRPWVIVCDFREAQDIQMHRSQDFDRARILEDIFGALLPNCHVWVSGSPRKTGKVVYSTTYRCPLMADSKPIAT